MDNDSSNAFYYAPVIYIQDAQQIPFTFSQYEQLRQAMLQAQRLKEEQNALIMQLNVINVEKEQVNKENQQLKDALSRGDLKIKRKYRKRRTYLPKQFRCNVRGCTGKYSSKIALNAHRRKKHPKRPRV